MKHLYIHIPFCHRRCAYCDFNTYAHMDDKIEAYVDALCAELRLLAATLVPAPPASDEAANLRPSIFIGGGTPTMLSLRQMERVLVAAAPLVPLDDAEVTCEANPGTLLDPDYLRGLRGLGVNRLSMGVQTLHDPTLRVLGRIHSADDARRSYAQARAAGFEQINLDFIFGLPEQTLAQWESTLDEVVTWQAEHFSLYSLILEEHTPLYAQVTAGRIGVPDEDASAAMYELAMERLGAAGYSQYEISNWARGAVPTPSLFPAYACQHNLAYWLNSDYLAAGAGAYGHLTAGELQRYANLPTIDGYISAMAAGRRPVAETIPLSAANLLSETMIMGLRLVAGVSTTHVAARCGADLGAIYGTQIADLIALGLLEQAQGRLRLTPRGRMLGNQVFVRFT
ncbi:MAG: radical SAM family heme chaperone HemW [Oscillochloris sp.]|nr:radical SAM family heme chaperone HemW [Oscillochloris sp.]